MEKDIFKDFSPDKAMDYDLGSAYGCPFSLHQGQISSMCSNAKQARSCFVHPACVSIITSTVFFTAKLSAAARARRDDCLLVISKSLHRCSGSRQGWLVGQAGLRWDYYGLSVPVPLPGRSSNAPEDRWLQPMEAPNPPVTMVSTPTHGVLQTLIGLFPF